ncbi:hypothetical protein CR513_10367, partial [Mucuna pruriens]
MTARTKIDIYFNIFEALKHPVEGHSIFSIDTIDRLVEEHMRWALAAIADFDSLSHIQNYSNSEDYISDQFVPPQSPTTELKPLSKHLKYTYLEDHKQFLEEKLLNVLRKHKKTIGWTLAGLQRNNPSIYMHKILLEEEARSIKQQ